MDGYMYIPILLLVCIRCSILIISSSSSPKRKSTKHERDQKARDIHANATLYDDSGGTCIQGIASSTLLNKPAYVEGKCLHLQEIWYEKMQLSLQITVRL
jgi:hypothetical protein